MKKLILITAFLLSILIGKSQEWILVRNDSIVQTRVPSRFEKPNGTIVAWGYNNSPDSILLNDGWLPYIHPEFNDSLQYIGGYVITEAFVSREIINKSQAQIDDELYNRNEVFLSEESIKNILKRVSKPILNSDSVTVEDINDFLPLYDAWDWRSMEYKKGNIVRYDSTLYEVIQPHTSQSGWDPKDATSLFTVFRVPGEVNEWEPPTAENPYMKGERVLFNGSTYESLIDNNVWSPATYPAGWQLID